MSDILIKNMKMPERCELCPFSGISGISCELISCTFTGKHRLFNDGQYLDDCPLVEVPSADVAPVKHGRWIEYPECLRYENAYSDDHIVCSECGEVFSILDNDTERFDFCPHCGADLRYGE